MCFQRFSLVWELWAIEAAGIDITDLVLIPFFLAYLGINYLIIKL
ncbi:hypothetical protein [Vulcanisaeta distributa]|nr:hypothetical protein [Vulcanisaeta distributa]